MSNPLFVAAYPYVDDLLGLPVEDLDRAVAYYSKSFGLKEVERRESPPTVIMERDGVQIGFAINGGDASNDGAAILVTNLDRARQELEAGGMEVGETSIDKRDGKRLRVFFAIAPDGLCFYFHQPVE